MKTYDENVTQLIRKEIVGALDEHEKAELEKWLDDSQENRDMLSKIRQEMRIAEEMPLFVTLDHNKSWDEFDKYIHKRKRRSKIGKTAWKTARYAAVLIPLVFILAVWIGKNSLPRQERNTPELSEIIAHSENSRPILITPDGIAYQLQSDQPDEMDFGNGLTANCQRQELVYNNIGAGPAEPVTHTLKIPRGGEFRVVLSDGTRVYLNSATEFEYPVEFNERERKVRLTGEAYFEVAKDSGRPFLVVMDELEIKVYGTEFNVNTHNPEYTHTVLASGSVGITDRETGKETVLHPGEMASFSRTTGRMEVSKVDVRQYTAWKDGYFAFENKRLEEILDIVSLWYNLDVVYEDESVKSYLFTAFMKRYEQISDMMSAIYEVKGVKFRIEGDTLVVYK